MRFAIAGAGTMPSPEHPDGIEKIIGWLVGIVGLVSAGAAAIFKRRQGLDEITDGRVKDLFNRYEKRIGDLEGKVERLEQTLSSETREKERALARVEVLEGQLAQEQREKAEAITAIAAVRLEDTGTIASLKAALEGLRLQNDFISAQWKRDHEQLRTLTPAKLLPAVQCEAELLVSPEGKILTADEGAVRLYGTSLVGEYALATIPERFHGKHLEGFVKALQTGEVPEHPQRVAFLRSDDSEVTVEMTLARVDEGFRARLRTLE